MHDDDDNEQIRREWDDSYCPVLQVIDLNELEDLLRDAILNGSAPNVCNDDLSFAEIDNYFAHDDEEGKVQQQKSYLRLLAMLQPNLAELLGGPPAQLHSVHFVFTRLAAGWSCQFTDEDHTRVFKEIHLETADEIFHTARQGRAFQDRSSRIQLDAAVAHQHGEIRLWLDDEQFRSLAHAD
ncbi:MAG: hypothetical protein JST28_09935 [Acidobacteria bacterium]|nr:hypothetical protein [Acidobacteriota bacterium]